MTLEHFNTILNDSLTSLQNNSDSDSNQATFPVDKTQVKKTRGRNKKYYHVETHETKEAAINSIQRLSFGLCLTQKTKKQYSVKKIFIVANIRQIEVHSVVLESLFLCPPIAFHTKFIKPIVNILGFFK